MATKPARQIDTSPRRVHFPVRQFLFLCIPVVVAILAIAFTFADMRINAEYDRITATERTYLRQLSGYVTADVSMSLIHLRALTQETATRNTMDSPLPEILNELQSAFMTIATQNPTYQQIRWVDESGVERVRIMRERQDVIAMDAQDLRDISDRDYFKAAKSLLAGEVYISHLDLGTESGSDRALARPVLRVATPVLDAGGRNRGILIINIAMRYMIDALHSINDMTTDTDYVLINQYGYWLSVPGGQTNEDIFQDELEGNFTHKHPAVWEQISTNHAGTAEQEGGLWIWEKISPDDAVRRVVLAESSSSVDIPVINSSDFSLILVAYKPDRVLAELRHDIFMTMTFGSILLILAYTWGILLLLRGQMQEKQADLEITYARARADQMERLKELEERFHLLVEASSVGMVVVNEEGRILMSNSSAEIMLGYGKGGLQGLSVDDLLKPGLRSQHARMRADYLRNPEVRKMGVGRKLEALTADGRSIPVEVALNPYLDKGKHVVLASIIET